MEIIDLNAAGGIGANCMALRLGDFTLVIDAGLHPKEKGYAALPSLEKIQDLPIDLVFLTHTHLDHLGALPVLLKNHPTVPVVTSEDSFTLFKRLLHNSSNLMERQITEGTFHGSRLYSHGDISRIARQVIPVKVSMPRHFSSDSGDRLTFTLYSSGHIPGAVGILLEHRHRRIFLTGDVLFTDTLMLDGARFPNGNLDVVIIETTRGMTERPPLACRESEIQRLLNRSQEVLQSGGSVLIPSFALGRLQEMLVTILKAREEGQFPRVPIYLSGLGIDLLNHFDQISRKNNSLRIRRNILRQLGAQKLPQGHSFEKAHPAIYLLSSGMLVENTPSWNAAARLLGSSKNGIFFVGYCDPDSPGGQLLATPSGADLAFPLLRKRVPVEASVERFDLSTHADRDELLEFAMGRNPQCVILTHGDPEARDWFSNQIRLSNPSVGILNPKPLEWTPVASLNAPPGGETRTATTRDSN